SGLRQTGHKEWKCRTCCGHFFQHMRLNRRVYISIHSLDAIVSRSLKTDTFDFANELAWCFDPYRMFDVVVDVITSAKAFFKKPITIRNLTFAKQKPSCRKLFPLKP